MALNKVCIKILFKSLISLELLSELMDSEHMCVFYVIFPEMASFPEMSAIKPKQALKH